MKYFVRLALIILAVIFGVWFIGATLIHSHDTEVNTEIAAQHPELANSDWSDTHQNWAPAQSNCVVIVDETVEASNFSVDHNPYNVVK